MPALSNMPYSDIISRGDFATTNSTSVILNNIILYMISQNDIASIDKTVKTNSQKRKNAQKGSEG